MKIVNSEFNNIINIFETNFNNYSSFLTLKIIEEDMKYDEVQSL